MYGVYGIEHGLGAVLFLDANSLMRTALGARLSYIIGSREGALWPINRALKKFPEVDGVRFDRTLKSPGSTFLVRFYFHPVSKGGGWDLMAWKRGR